MIRPHLVEEPTQRPGDFSPIVRPRVLERIAVAARQRVALVVAPAGCGKSVAVHHYLDTVRRRVIHYDLRPEHGTLLGFVRGLAEAIEPHAPDALNTVSGAYEKNQASSDPVAGLAIWLSAHLHDFSAIIAIDDLHLAEATPAVSALIEALVARCREQSWIIVSRSFCDLPVGTWFASGVIGNVVTESDLSFGLDEANAAARAVNTSLSTDAIVDIATATGGWAAALSIALRTSSSAGDIKRSSATRDLLYRYLAEQVYRTLSEREREILELCCLEPSISASTWLALGYQNAEEIIGALQPRIPLTQALDGHIYRCHDLFRDFVLFQISRTGAAYASRVQRALADALLASGQTAAAMRVFAGCGDHENVLSCLRIYGFDLIETGKADLVESAINSLPTLHEDPILLGIRGELTAFSGEIALAEAYYRRAIKATVDPVVSANLTVRFAVMQLTLRQNPEEDLKHALRGITNEPGFSLEILSLLAFCSSLTQNKDEALLRIGQCHDLFGPHIDKRTKARALLRIGASYADLGLLEQSELALEEASMLATEEGLLSLAARAMQIHGGAIRRYGLNDARVLSLMRNSFDIACRAGDTIAAYTALLWSIDIALDQSDFANIDQYLEQLRSLAIGDPLRESYSLETDIFRSIERGGFSEAGRIIDVVRPHLVCPEDVAVALSLRALCCAFEEDVAGYDSTFSEAASTLDGLSGDTVISRRQSVQSYAFLAIASTVSRKKSVARQCVARLSQYAFPMCAAVRACLDHLISGYPWLSLHVSVAASISDIESQGGGRIALVLRSVFSEVARRQRRVVLTSAESLILRDLRAGLAPKQIAEKSGRSVLTVRTHIRKMIEKSGCSGTLELIAASHELLSE